MLTRKLIERLLVALLLTSLVASGTVPALAYGRGPGDKEKYKQKIKKAQEKKDKRIDHAERQATADLALQQGALNPLMVEAQAAALIDGAPHYFSHPNYANSPLPTVVGTLAYFGNPLVDRAYASDYAAVTVGELSPVFVVLADAPLPDGTLQSFQTWNQALQGASPFPSAGNVFHAYVLRPTTNPNEYFVVFDSGLLTVPALADPAVSEIADFPVADLAVQAGDLLALYGQGIPVDTGVGTDILSVPANTPPLQNSTITLSSDAGAAFPFHSQSRTYSFGAQVIDSATTVISGGMRKFVDGLPGLNAANNLDQEMPVAVPDTTTYPGSDYYEIELVEYTEQMHSDLPPTTLRGYRQAGGTAHYLGAAIVAQKDRPVRVLFRNLLLVGQGGDLFIPTDTSVMGSGMGPDLNGMPETDPQNPTCDAQATTPKVAGCFTENRAVVHLHGGLSPWISDGTPHQWITPAGEELPYPDADLLADPNAQDHDNAVENKGVSVEYVPDMWFDANGDTIAACAGETFCDPAIYPDATNNPGRGEQTYYWTNQQSARLMFYHDHAWGITRLNVYAGVAAPYLIQDDTEAALTGPDGALEGLGIGTPLVVQDKTFVPSDEQLAVSDETWDKEKWGGLGNLWLPHVYSPAQNPGHASGVNEFGRWAYGPWFWPPTNNISYPPVDNPYYCGPDGLKLDGVTTCAPACDPDIEWCEPPLMPGTPFNSMGMEAFHDTPVINGTAYPTINLSPGEHRFRILNAASDRFFNLALYQADPLAPTEVLLNPDEVAAALLDGTVFPTPVVGTEGPAWIQIANEGGFLPAPVVIDAQPTTWVNDPTLFNAGNVDGHSLLLGPAERADVLVDLAPFAGQTLILYNDAPGAFPARDPRYDYYTGNGDYRDTGGTPPTLPGYGPNIRTVMQIVVGTPDPGAPFPNPNANHVNQARLDLLNAAFAYSDGAGVFASGQHPIIVGQAEYNSAYGTSFSTNGPLNGTAQIFDNSMTFDTLSGVRMVDFPFGPKQIQDEMGEAFDRDYGRMSGFLGVESPNPQAGLQNMILYPYVNPASELINTTFLPMAADLNDPAYEVTPISVATDGTQIWKITHNGVDTHPIHFHLFDVQVLNRVGWDGIIRKPHPNELGWKDTVRISPLEDTIVALRPLVPDVPFDVPNSTRPLNPAMPTGSSIMFTNMDAWGEPTDPIVNVWTNFGWEYVWHCHILSHEEMDMMRPISVGAPPNAPTGLVGWRDGNGNKTTDFLEWADNSGNETAFIVQRADRADGAWADVVTLPPDATVHSYQVGNKAPVYFYRVIASNLVGYVASDDAYDTMLLESLSNVVEVPAPAEPPPPPPPLPADPTGLTAVAQDGPQVLLDWTDNATDESGFVIERAPVDLGPDGEFDTADDIIGAFAPLPITIPASNNTGPVSYSDVTVAVGNAYAYQVAAFNAGGYSGYTNTATELVPAPPVPPDAPAAPENVNAAARPQGKPKAKVEVTWTDVADNETGYVIQRSTNAEFTALLVTETVGAGVTSFWSRNLARTTPYYYRVQAVNDFGPSAWVNATPFPVTTP